MQRYGYHGKILSIDLTASTSVCESRNEEYFRTFGGGGLLATALIVERTAAGTDALGPENLLVFASSVVAGQPAPGLARFTTAAKSPLTGGIGETRTEGPFGVALKQSGADVIAIRGAAKTPSVIEISEGEVTFHDATELWGLTVGAATDALLAEFGDDAHCAVIGPAGERGVRFASIITDRTFAVSRMGMGAVMGSKRIKAIVIRGGELPAVAEPSVLERITRRFEAAITGNSLSRWQRDAPGFSCWIYLHGLDASLCVENYRRSEFEGLAGFAEPRFLEHSVVDLPCPGCPNNCIKAIQPSGQSGLDMRASGIHQEITGAMGPNLGIGDLDAVLAANNLCNQLGLDPTSLGFTLSFAAECFAEGALGPSDNAGRSLSFGSAEPFLTLAEEIAYRRGLGDTLAEGTRIAAREIGGGADRYAMHVKGLEMVPFEPRSQTNLALGYGVAPIGPRYDICEHDWDFDTEVGWDHTLEYSRTLGILERVPMGYMGPSKVRNFKALYTLWSAADALDFCIFAIAPTRLLSMPLMTEILAAVTGWETSSWEIMKFGERRAHLMRWYNLREGLTIDDDMLPARFYEEPISGGPQKGALLDREAYRESVRTFYAMMGWDREGVPCLETLYEARLEQFTD